MQLREKLISLGLMEVMTYSFISKEDINNTNSDLSHHLQIDNPLSSEQDYLRTSLLPSHLRAASNNMGSKYSVMFEISRVYEKSPQGVNEGWVLALTAWGNESLSRTKGVIDCIMGWYGIGLGVKRNDGSDIFIPGRSAIIDPELGYFGQIKPLILNKYSIKDELSFVQLDIAKVVGNKKTISAKPPLPYQIVYKDITIELPQPVLYQEIANKISKTLHSVEFLYDFQNDELKQSKRKRITIKVGLDLGPNPKAQDISISVEKSTKILESIQKAKVL
jgi:phenylalanyl-tRNA synthetase beta chain